MHISHDSQYIQEKLGYELLCLTPESLLSATYPCFPIYSSYNSQTVILKHSLNHAISLLKIL